MKYAYVLLAAAAGLVAAQSRDDIPKCALPCLDDAIKQTTDCSVDDTKCVCAAFDKIQGPATACVIKACGATVAVEEVLPATQALCANPGEGEEEPPKSSSAAPAPSSSAAPAPSSSAAEASSSAAVTESTSVTLVPSSTIVTVPTTPTSSAATTPGAPLPTGAAAGMGSIGGLAMLALGALAL